MPKSLFSPPPCPFRLAQSFFPSHCGREEGETAFPAVGIVHLRKIVASKEDGRSEIQEHRKCNTVGANGSLSVIESVRKYGRTSE